MKYEIKEKPNMHVKFLLLIVSLKQLEINDPLKCSLFIKTNTRLFLNYHYTGSQKHYYTLELSYCDNYFRMNNKDKKQPKEWIILGRK